MKGTTLMPTAEYRLEKSGHVIRAACRLIERSEHDNTADLQSCAHEILWNATKLFCDTAREIHGQERYALTTWSPELLEFLSQHPGECGEALKIVASEDYRDGYYDAQKPAYLMPDEDIPE
jgi:hypothetical protein